MKNIEVVDLVSSPDIAPPRPRDRPQTSSSLKTASSKLVAATSSRPNVSEKENDVWLLLSDDSDTLPEAALPSTIKAVPKVPSSEALKAPTLDFGNGWSFANIPATTAKCTEQYASGKSNFEDVDDYFYLSDDLDSNANPNKSSSFGVEPASKKPKLSPQPEESLRRKLRTETCKGKGLSRASSDAGAGLNGSSASFSISKAGGLRRTNTTVMDNDPVLSSSLPDIPRTTNSKPEKSGRELMDDPILFTSSPDIVKAARERREKIRRERVKELNNDANDDASEEDPFDGIISYSLPKASMSLKSSTVTKRKAAYIEEVSSDLENLPDILTITSQVSISNASKMSRKDSDYVLARYNAEKEAAQKAYERDQKVHAKDRKGQEKLESQEAEKEKRRLAREEKAIQKSMAADVAKVNQKRTEKKVSTPEMIVDLPMDLDKHVAIQIGKFLEPLGAGCEEWHSRIPNVIRWRRKVEAKYNEELGHWEPVPKHVEVEKQVMCIMGAEEFVELARSDEGRCLDAHVANMKAQFVNYSLIYLIEGLMIWQRKNKNIKNREFTKAVRSQMSDGTEAIPSSQRPRKKKQPEYVDADKIEDTLLNLQIIHGVLIHHTSAPTETAEWVVVFTQHISTAPYRQQQMTLDTAFCMDAGQVKTGDDADDTFVKMLQEVNRITAPIAYGIAAKYPSVQKLVAGFEEHGKTMLQNLKKTANKDGALTDREIGPRISHRVYNIFMGRDHRSTDV